MKHITKKETLEAFKQQNIKFKIIPNNLIVKDNFGNTFT